jgi:hypothetical protein
LREASDPGEPLQRRVETAMRFAGRLCSSFDSISFSKNESKSKKSVRSVS